MVANLYRNALVYQELFALGSVFGNKLKRSETRELRYSVAAPAAVLKYIVCRAQPPLQTPFQSAAKALQFISELTSRNNGNW